jgi:chromosome segregation ATPase
LQISSCICAERILRVLASTAKEGSAGAFFRFPIRVNRMKPANRTAKKGGILGAVSDKWQSLRAKLDSGEFEHPEVKKVLSRLENASATPAGAKPTIFSRAGEMVRNFRARQQEFGSYYARIAELEAEIERKNGELAKLEAAGARLEAQIRETKKSIAIGRERLAKQEKVDRSATDLVRAIGFPI